MTTNCRFEDLVFSWLLIGKCVSCCYCLIMTFSLPHQIFIDVWNCACNVTIKDDASSFYSTWKTLVHTSYWYELREAWECCFHTLYRLKAIKDVIIVSRHHSSLYGRSFSIQIYQEGTFHLPNIYNASQCSYWYVE